MNNDIQELLDKQSIYEVLVRYCRGVDRCDEALIRSTYHEDGTDEHGYWRGKGHDFAPFIVDRLTKANSSTTHAITNTLIEVEGDKAWSETQVVGTLLRRDSDPLQIDTLASRYVDKFSRRNGEWRIDERTCVLDYFKTEIVSTDTPVPIDGFIRGARYPTDPLYKLLSSQHAS